MPRINPFNVIDPMMPSQVQLVSAFVFDADDGRTVFNVCFLGQAGSTA